MSSAPIRSARRQSSRRPPLRVLIVSEADGFFTVYAGREVIVHMVQRLHTDEPSAEAAIDEYLDATLPPRFRGLYAANMIRAMGQARQVTAEDEADRRLALDLARELRAIGRGSVQEPAAIRRARRTAR